MRSKVDFTFENMSVDLDGWRYEGCSFDNCVLIFRGGELPELLYNRFRNTTVTFDDGAKRTLQLLTILYATGAAQLVEKYFAAIRKGGIDAQQFIEGNFEKPN